MSSRDILTDAGREVGRFEVTGSRTVACVAHGHTLAEAVEAFREQHFGVVPDYWMEGEDHDTGGEIIGLCEGCERAILDGEKYGHDPEGGYYECSDCRPTSPAQQNAPTEAK